MHKTREWLDYQQAAEEGHPLPKHPLDKPVAKLRPWDKVVIHPGNNKSTTIIPSGKYSIQPGKYNRTERDPFYHTNRWKKASARFLKANPLCVNCGGKGIINAAKVTDHITPKPICDDPWDETNWQPLCGKCHKEKSAKDKAMIAKKQGK